MNERDIAVIIEIEPNTADKLNKTQNGIYIANVENERPLKKQYELNCNDPNLHSHIKSRVFIVPNVIPGQELRVIFAETKQEEKFTVPLDCEFCEVTLKD